MKIYPCASSPVLRTRSILQSNISRQRNHHLHALTWYRCCLTWWLLTAKVEGMLYWTLRVSVSDVTARAGPSAWMIPPLAELQYSRATRDSLIKNPVWRNLSGSVSVASARSGGIQMSAADSASLLRLLRYGEWTSERSAPRTDRKHRAHRAAAVVCYSVAALNGMMFLQQLPSVMIGQIHLHCSEHM